ncbi:MAG: T9SS type A sorting domain-containing protein [Bacteroidia bacterium]
MKKTLHIITTLAFCGAINMINAQNLQWAKQMGGAGSDRGLAMAIDNWGNVYSTGTFSGTADFDPGVGISNLISTGSNDIYISKQDSEGNLIWAKQIGGTDYDEGVSINIDGNNNIFIGGVFEGTTDFDSGVGTANLTSSGESDIFILKLDTAGNFIWVKQFGGINIDYLAAMIQDATGNLYASGHFSDSVDFDPGVNNLTLTSEGADDIFIFKLNANGNLDWAKHIGGNGNDYGSTIALDASNNVYVSGSFQQTVDFDSSVGISDLTSASSDDVFLLKLDALGNYSWVKGFGGIGEGYTIACDMYNNVYLGSYFSGSADFDPSINTTLNLSSFGGSVDIVVSKLDALGNLIWAKQIGGTGSEYAPCIVVNSAGNVYISGTFSETADIDPNTGTSNLISTGSQDIFIAELNSSGNLLWANSIGGVGSDVPTFLTIDSTDAIYSIGYFSGNVDFDPNSGNINLVSAGGADIFIMKLAAPALGIKFNTFDNSVVSVYPNPSNGNNIYVQSSKNLSKIEITNSIGKIVHSSSPQINNTVIDLTGVTKGIYFITVTNDDGNLTTKKLLLTK